MNSRARRFDMKALFNLFVLMLASFALASCGGGGGGSNSAFGGPANDTTLTLSATTTTLPLNPYSVGQQQSGTCPGNFLGSPYISEVTATWRHKDGSLVSGTSTINVSVTPTTILSFSTLNSTSGSGGSNACPTLLGSGPVNVTAGIGTIYVHSGQVPGPGTLSVTAIDPSSNQTISAQLTITVAGAASGLPASVVVTGGSAYVTGSGGPQSATLTATVKDGSNALVQNPSGFDNVEFSIVGPSGIDARLSAVNAAGSSVSGTTVDTVTHNGIANVAFLAGSQQGPVQVKATVDRGDGNVDNGISDPVSSTATVVVSDGKLYSLSLTSPGSNAPAILIDRVSAQATLSSQGSGGSAIPPDPNAVYSLTVSAIGTDRQGNPVVPGTVIKFGSIDSPIDNSTGFYSISGNKGDPQEGGSLFSATDGRFTTAGGGTGPGDTLLVFGKLVNGNSDLENADTVSSVQNAQNLTVTTPFNLNDTTGTSVNNGPVIPYIIGRAQIGNISSPASTDNTGTASTTLNYPVSQLGHITAIWAQGAGTDNITGGTKVVTDINLAAFPGVAPATIIVSPNPFPGNTTTSVQACIVDLLGSPLSGVQFQFAFSNLGVGTGSVDGVNNGGAVPVVTDASGCVNTTVTTAGIAGSSGSGGGGTPTLTFSAGSYSGSATISASGGLILLAKPSSFYGTDGGLVTLTLLSSNGTPVPGVQLTGTCTGDSSIGIVSGPGVTNSSGQTTASISANLNIPTKPGSGSCTFTTATGSPTVIVKLQGVDPCLSGVSPKPTGCSATP